MGPCDSLEFLLLFVVPIVLFPDDPASEANDFVLRKLLS